MFIGYRPGKGVEAIGLYNGGHETFLKIPDVPFPMRWLMPPIILIEASQERKRWLPS